MDEPVGVDVADLAEREHAGGDVSGGGLLRVAFVDDAPAGRVAEVEAALGAGRHLVAVVCRATSASNGATARPTDPGCSSQSVLLIDATVPDSVPP